MQGLIVIGLFITNYLSFFYHEQFVKFVYNLLNAMEIYSSKMMERLICFVQWLYFQEYDFSFNNREIAVVIIIIIVLIPMVINRNIRKTMTNILKALFNNQFNKIYFETSVYTIAMVYILYKLGFWKFIYTKDTLIWVLFSAIFFSFKTIADKSLKEILKNAFGATVIIEFLLNTFTFSVIMEVIVMAILTVMALLISYSDRDSVSSQEYQVNRVLVGINAYIGLNILIFLIFEIFNNFESLLTLEILKSFLLPIILTIMYIPYLSILVFRVYYDKINVYIRMNKLAKRWLVSYFKIRMYLFCKFNKEKILGLRRFNHLIINMGTKNDVDKIFRYIQTK